MKPHFLGSLAAILVSITVPATAHAQGKKEADPLPPLPSTNAVHFVVLASATDQGGEGIRLRVVMPISGPTGPEHWMQKFATVDDKAWRVVDARGRRVDPKTLPKLLKKLTPVVFAPGKQPDPFHLQTMRDDALVIVAPRESIQDLEDAQ